MISGWTICGEAPGPGRAAWPEFSSMASLKAYRVDRPPLQEVTPRWIGIHRRQGERSDGLGSHQERVSQTNVPSHVQMQRTHSLASTCLGEACLYPFPSCHLCWSSQDGA